MKFNSWATLKINVEGYTEAFSEQEIDVTVEITYIFLGYSGNRFDPEEDPELEFYVKDELGFDITEMLDDSSSERIAEECFERYKSYLEDCE